MLGRLRTLQKMGETRKSIAIHIEYYVREKRNETCWHGRQPTSIHIHTTAIINTSVIRAVLYGANLIIIEHNIVRSIKCVLFFHIYVHSWICPHIHNHVHIHVNAHTHVSNRSPFNSFAFEASCIVKLDITACFQIDRWDLCEMNETDIKMSVSVRLTCDLSSQHGLDAANSYLFFYAEHS